MCKQMEKVAHAPITGGQGVVGSNPATPTIFQKKFNKLWRYLTRGFLLAADLGSRWVQTAPEAKFGRYEV